MKKNIFFLIFSILIYAGIYIYIYPIFSMTEVVFPYALHPFNIVKEYPELWNKIIKAFNISNILVFFILNYMSFINYKRKEQKNNKKVSKKNDSDSNLIKKIKRMLKTKRDLKKEDNKSNLKILLGFNESEEPIWLKEKALYQNVLITGDRKITRLNSSH